MRCKYCGMEIPDASVFCTYCGKETGVRVQDELTYLVSSAREGNQVAVSELYEKTYSKVYYTVKSMVKDEDAVLDIVQDTYIKAFTHLSGLDGDGKFLPWVRQIAANTARDYFKKKRPALFTDIAPDDGDTPAEELFADERGAYIPEQVIDENETKRLIREIIDDLPEDQRAVIGMYYYEELSVREIAAALDATESAVKSRLMYGRKKIEAKVRELEKKGTKLYGLAPIPFLLLLLKNQDASAAEIANGRILQTILQTTAPAVPGVAAATASVATGGKFTAAINSFGVAKFAAIVLTAAVVTGGLIGTGILGISRLTGQNDNAQPAAETAAVTVTPEPTTSPADEAMEQYRIIVANAKSYSFDQYSVSGNGKYRYALVQMQPTDIVPTLLLEMEDSYNMSYMRAFQYDPSSKTVHQPADSLTEGVAARGGYRGFIGAAADGNGLLCTEMSSGSGSTTITRATLQGDSLVQTSEWSGRMDMIPSGYETTQLDWHDISDLSALGGSAAQTPAQLPTDGSRTVLTGTVRTCSYNEVLALQNISDPNPGSSTDRTYVLIVLDEPQTISAMDGDGVSQVPSSNSANMINVTTAPTLSQYNGQHIVFSIDPHTTYWPSDTSLPLGEPSTEDVHILNG